MSGNIAHLSDFKEFDGGYVTFGGGANRGRITGKGTIKTDKLDFEDVYFVKELKFNLFSVSQMCDKKNYVLFTDSECLVLSPNFKLPDENQILLKIPRQNNMYSFDMKNIVLRWFNLSIAKAYTEGIQCYGIGGFGHVYKEFLSPAYPLNKIKIVCPCQYRKDASYFYHKLITGSREVSTVAPEVNIATPEGLMGPIPITEDTQVEDQKIELGNISPSYEVSSTPHTRIHKDPTKLISDWERLTRTYIHAFLLVSYLKKNQREFLKLLVIPAWVEAMQEELLQFKLQNVLVLIDLPKGHRAIGTNQQGHILLVQIYVDDIIFGSTKKELCEEFEKLMKDKFQMSSMGELTFFLGFQIYDLRSWMYLTTSRNNIMIAVCALQGSVSPKTYPSLAVQRIFRYLKGKPSLGIWYSKDSPLELVAYIDSDYAGATLDKKSTTGGCQFLGNRLISGNARNKTVVYHFYNEAEYVAAAKLLWTIL
ncbi:putative ribonuclease H-like domain-containing protein [Tanacetum coccineum]|uniref:Ribonuclease H-like domain-containing protein n=1 Tax=Tanacetum coccineum TaxID=301880 RepID=A0ABQ5BQX5_9ASTR